MNRAPAAWVLIIAAETVHGMLRQWLLVPVVGDLRARQIGVAIARGPTRENGRERCSTFRHLPR